jgi:hypothetical protein
MKNLAREGHRVLPPLKIVGIVPPGLNEARPDKNAPSLKEVAGTVDPVEGIKIRGR